MDDLVVQYIVDNHAKEAQAKLQIAKPLVTRPLHLAIRRTYPDAQGIIDRFNAQLRGMITDRTYHRLLNVDWIRADVDGDGLFEYVPESDKAGAAEPQRAYSIAFATEPEVPLRRRPSRRAPLLRRRQHLPRLGVGAQSLQDVGRHAAESVASDGEPRFSW